MSCIKSLLRHTSIGIALISELAIVFNLTVTISPSTATTLHEDGKSSASQQARKQNPPPPRRNPGSSAAGGRRDPAACPQDVGATTTGPLLTALGPTIEPGLTLSAHPTFLVYVPRTSAETAEFSLSSRASQGVYRTTIALTNTPDIIRITLPDQVAPLEVDRQYTWSFAVICNPDDRIADQFVTSAIQRTELDPHRLRQIEQTPLRQRIALYQEEGIWYDAVALLFELKHNQPDDPDIDTAWRDFLQSGGVDTTINISPVEPR